MNANEPHRSEAAHSPWPLQEELGLLERRGQTVAVAESLTCGTISARLGAIDGASSWFLGGIVAYAERVKFDLLGVQPGPVINRDSARQMATGVARLFGADFAVSATGVGGPGPQEDQPQGTVFIAILTPDGSDVTDYRFAGEPSDIVHQATQQALRDLARALRTAR